MDNGSMLINAWLIKIGGALIVGLFGIIAFFLVATYRRLSGFMTREECTKNTTACHAIEALRLSINEKADVALEKKFDSFIDSFDDLCKCLSKFTEGKCP